MDMMERDTYMAERGRERRVVATVVLVAFPRGAPRGAPRRPGSAVCAHRGEPGRGELCIVSLERVLLGLES